MQPAYLCRNSDDSVAVRDGHVFGSGLLLVLQPFVCTTFVGGLDSGVAGEEALGGQGVGAQGQEVDAFIAGFGPLGDGGMAGTFINTSPNVFTRDRSR